MRNQVDRPWRTKELAEALGVHPRTVMRWLSTGEVKSTKVARSVFIPPQEVRRILHGEAPS